MRQDLIELLGKIVGNDPLSQDQRLRALDIFSALLELPTSGDDTPEVATALSGEFSIGGPSTAVAGNRRLVYVHGICRHVAGFSNPWWDALHPFVPSTFGAGVLGQSRREVVWSDIVNQASATLATAVAGVPQPAAITAQTAKEAAANEIKEALRDRADQQQMNAGVQTVGFTGAASATDMTAGGIGIPSIPGLNCVDDFSLYLTSDSIRQQILDRFMAVVRPLLQAGNELDIISHSWGTVVAYEGLRQLEDQGLTTPLVRNFFTVGAALSIGPVKARLRPANKDGKKPRNVKRWINLDAHGDIVGGPLKGRPYNVDADFVNLEPTGCGSFLSFVGPQCAHGSYFVPANVAVNRDIFAKNIV